LNNAVKCNLYQIVNMNIHFSTHCRI